MPLESTGTGGATIYLRIQDVDNGNQCMDGFRLPGDSSFKTDTFTDLNKLLMHHMVDHPNIGCNLEDLELLLQPPSQDALMIVISSILKLLMKILEF